MHMFAYYSPAITNVAGTYVVPPVNDGWLPVTDDGFAFPRQHKMLGAYSQANVLNRIYFNHQTWRDIGPHDLRIASTTVTSPGSFVFNFDGQPTALIPDGGAFKLYYERTTLGASSVLCGVMSSERLTGRDTRPLRSFRFTASLTSIAGVWVETQLNPAQTLPSGSYQVVGIAAIGTPGGFTRLRFKNQNNMPGCFNVNAVSSTSNPFLRNTIAGVVGTFTETTIPEAQFLSLTNGAATYTVILDLVRV